MALEIPWPLPDFADLTDGILDALRAETKRMLKATKAKEGHIQRAWSLESSVEPERKYRVYTRQLRAVQAKFSCGLILELPGRKLVLCRYNGPSHAHTNSLPPRERCRSEVSHRHMAIAQYLAAGQMGDRYAVSDGRFTTLEGALHWMVQDCGISGIAASPESPNPWMQMPLSEDE